MTKEKVCTCKGCKGEGTSTCGCGCLDEKTLNNPHISHCGHHGDDSHDHSHHMKSYLYKFIISTILSIPVIILSPIIQGWFNYSLVFPYSEYIVFGLSIIIVIYGGKPFYEGLINEIKHRSPGMMSLVSVAITISFIFSSLVTFKLVSSQMDFYWELVTLIDIMLLGHYIEMKSTMVATNALKSITELLPQTANLYLDNKETIEVPIKDLTLNQVVLVKPGDKVPVDGIIIDGVSTIDESMITGESNPVLKEINNEVLGGTINGDGSLLVKITKLGDETYLNQVIKLVDESLGYKSNTQRLADIAAKYLFYVSVSVALITWLIWGLVGASGDMILERIVTVIVITCPHALGVAIPLVTSVSTSLAARNGLLIKNRNAFENANKINHVIFDKTGTLTYGKFSVTQFINFNKDEQLTLNIANQLESNSNHPLAKGIVDFTKNKAKLIKISNFENIVGQGITATYNNELIGVVSPNYLKLNKINYNHDEYLKLISEGNTVVYIFKEKEVLGLLSLKDEIKPSAIKAINSLHKMGIHTHMLTGDNEIVADLVAKELGITSYRHSVLPHEKSNFIEELNNHGNYIAMAGDGINDAPALAMSDLGIAIGAGTDVAINTADVILVKSDPNDIVNLLKLAKSTKRKIIENLLWALGYNVITLPLAAGILEPFGISISPAFGALLMSVSTVVVALNARLLKIKK
ncbi:MAG: copper-translocating P-type ATPase [Acholeplasmataceae bacterium]